MLLSVDDDDTNTNSLLHPTPCHLLTQHGTTSKKSKNNGLPNPKSTQLDRMCDIPGCTKLASRSRLKRQMIMNAPIIDEADKVRLLEIQEKLYICGSHNWQLKGKGRSQRKSNASSSQNDIDSVFNDMDDDSQFDRDELEKDGSMCGGSLDGDDEDKKSKLMGSVIHPVCHYEQGFAGKDLWSDLLPDHQTSDGTELFSHMSNAGGASPSTTGLLEAPTAGSPATYNAVNPRSQLPSVSTPGMPMMMGASLPAQPSHGLSHLLQHPQVQTLLQHQQVLLQRFLQQQHHQLTQLLQHIQQQRMNVGGTPNGTGFQTASNPSNPSI